MLSGEFLRDTPARGYHDDMAEGPSIAIEVGRRTARAVWLSHSRDPRMNLTVRKAMVAEIPADLRAPSGNDPDALGNWLGEQLKLAGIPRSKAVIALPRELVGLKRMNLPTVDDAELPDMVRLAMQRELPFDAAGMVIDFIPQERSATSTAVLAVALPQPVLAATQSMARAAGLSIGRITLSTMGAAALGELGGQKSVVREQKLESLDRLTFDSRPLTSSLVIDLTGDSIELVVVVNGTIRFSRAAELPAATDRSAITDAVITETRRTWTSYRTAEEAVDVQDAVLLGDPRVGELATKSIEEIIKVKPRVLHQHESIESANGEALDRMWPLIGLLREPDRRVPQIDLANPRRAPDIAAQKRKRRVLAAAACVLGVGLLFTMARLNLRSLQAQTGSLSQAQSGGAGEYARYWRDLYKLDHLKQWQSSRIDWLERANYLMQFSPPPDQVVLDSWSGSIDPVDVRFDSKTRAWRTPREVTIVLDGEARDRETADAFRAKLVNDSMFSTSSTGADTKGGRRLPFGFTYRLREKDDKKAAPSISKKTTPSAATGEPTP